MYEIDKEYMKTEQYALEEEAQEVKWQETYGKKLPELIACMDELLMDGSETCLAELQDMFFSENAIFNHYKQTDVFAQMYLVLGIYKNEIQNDEKTHILSFGKSVEELQAYLQKLKFLLYRIDFGVGETTECEFVLFLKENMVSTVTLEMMLLTNVMRPANVALTLMEIFKENRMRKELFWILQYIKSHCPEQWSMISEQ